MTRMIIIVWFLSVLSAFLGGFFYGKNQLKAKIVEKQVEVIKYVAQKRAKIQAMPNANRDELLELMRDGKL